MIASTPQIALSDQDVEAIRDLLPYDWRKQVAKKTGLKERQISDVFYLRTTNPTNNQLVWEAIKTVLLKLGQNELAEKAQQRVDQTKLF